MYTSRVLKRAMEFLYTTDPWRTAIQFPWFKELSRVDPEYRSSPPIAFVAFVASAVSRSICMVHNAYPPKFQYRNALDCLIGGTEETVPFGEAGYVDIYNDLYDLIEEDVSHPDHGETVRRNLKSLIADITA